MKNNGNINYLKTFRSILINSIINQVFNILYKWFCKYNSNSIFSGLKHLWPLYDYFFTENISK